MKLRKPIRSLPRAVIELTTYAQLDLYLEKFSSGELGLVILLGRLGTGKSESVKRALGVRPCPDDSHVAHVIALQHDPSLRSDQDRVDRFITTSGASRATYYRIKATLKPCLE